MKKTTINYYCDLCEKEIDAKEGIEEIETKYGKAEEDAKN